jgi:thioredoxin-dependent peroxiredoxin
MKAKEHQLAIDFEVTDIYGKEIKLSDFKGKKIHLGFFRNVNCPFCNLRVHQLSKFSHEFEKKGLKIIYFFESKPEVLRRSTFHQGVSPIPLTGDPQRKVYTLYGVKPSMMKMMSTILAKGTMGDMKAGKGLNLPQDKDATQSLIPADFLIDEQFNIRTAYYGKNLNDHISIDEIKRFAGI